MAEKCNVCPLFYIDWLPNTGLRLNLVKNARKYTPGASTIGMKKTKRTIKAVKKQFEIIIRFVRSREVFWS